MLRSRTARFVDCKTPCKTAKGTHPCAHRFGRLCWFSPSWPFRSCSWPAAAAGGGEDPQKVLQRDVQRQQEGHKRQARPVAHGHRGRRAERQGPHQPQRSRARSRARGPARSRKFDLDLKIGAQGQNFTAGAISTGDKGYIKLQGNTYAVSDQVFNSFKQGFQRSQAQQNGTKQNPSLSSLGVNPKRLAQEPSEQGRRGRRRGRRRSTSRPASTSPSCSTASASCCRRPARSASRRRSGCRPR